jgi:hypothetical protein
VHHVEPIPAQPRRPPQPRPQSAGWRAW